MNEILTEKETAVIRNAIGNPLLTNCYLSYNAVINEIAAHKIYCLGYNGIVILIHKMNGFHKMYYFLKTKDSLIPELVKKIQKDLAEYSNLEATVVAKMPDKNVDILERFEFHPYKKYIRKQKVVETENWCETTWLIETADIRDLNNIYQLLYSISDIMSDHLVSKEELHAFLESSQVLKVVIDGELAGALVFEFLGKKSYLRSICVSHNFIGKKIGLSLIKHYIEKNKNRTKLFYLWVESTNEKAIQLYEKLGYKNDGLVEYIYIKD